MGFLILETNSSPHDPNEKFEGVLQRHPCRQFIVFLRGSPLVHHDLERCQAHLAAGIFVTDNLTDF